MVRGFLDGDRDNEFCGDFFDRTPDDEALAAVSKRDWRIYKRALNPYLTDDQCDSDWRKYLAARRR